MVDVARDELLGQPQLLISINRANAARYGINTSDESRYCANLHWWRCFFTELIEGERRFSVILRYGPDYRADVDDFQNILLVTPNGSRIPLSFGHHSGKVMVRQQFCAIKIQGA